MTSYIVVYLLFLLQFIYFPVGVSFFETPKVYLAQLGIFILFILTIVRSEVPLLKHVSKRDILLFGSIALLGVLHLLFFRTDTTLFGNDFRLQGVLLLWLLLVWAVVSSKISLEKVLHPYFIFGCLVAQLIASFLISGEGIDRAIGTIGEPNALAATVLFVWPFLYFSKQKHPAWLPYAAMIIVFLIAFISGSRSGMIAFILQLVFIALSKMHVSLGKNILICFALLVLTYSLPFLPQTNLYEQRSEIWQGALSAGWHNPIVGNGFGNTQYALENAVNQLHNNLRGSFVDSSHNIFLDWWVQGGIIGFGLFTLLIVLTFQRFIHNKKPLYVVLLLGLIAALSFNPASIVSLIALWWIIGQGMAL